ncbi:MAG TPA: OmpA family protein [Myxococcales bacterium]
MRRPSLLVAALAIALALPARAADDPLRRGIDPVPTKLSPSIDSVLTTDGGRTSPEKSFRLDLGIDYAAGLLSLKMGDRKLNDLIEHRLDLHLLGAYAFTDWLEVGLDVPVTAYQKTDFAALERATGFADREPSSAGMGDVRLQGKFRLLREEEHYVTVSALAEVRVPTGADASFLGERSVLVYPRAIVERTFLGRLRVGLDLGYRFRALPGRYLNLYVGDELAFAAAGSVDLPPLFSRQWSVGAEVLVSTPARAPFSTSDAFKTPVEVLLGLKVQLWKNFYAQLGGGTGYFGESGLGHEAWRFLLTVGYTRVWHDRDGDGIADSEDGCPDQAEDKDNFEDEDGCPDPDNDKDGIPDAQDQCPDVPGTAKMHGCPDTDGDGIPDFKDRCPKEAGPAEYDGCPDSDNDEVPDVDDKCPDKPGPAEADGCPKAKPWVVYEAGKLILKDAVHFDSGRASIKQNSLPILDDLAGLLKLHPEIKKVRIDGHTDNQGPAVMNLELSQKRAEAVVAYLVAKGGIEPGRLSAKGFGLERPIGSNATPLGRAKNRRVECSILE